MTTVGTSASELVGSSGLREDLNPFHIAQLQFDIAAEYLKFDGGLRQLLRRPERVLEVAVPIRMDDNQIKAFTGYRVQHSAGPRQRRHPVPSRGDAR